MLLLLAVVAVIGVVIRCGVVIATVAIVISVIIVSSVVIVIVVMIVMFVGVVVVVAPVVIIVIVAIVVIVNSCGVFCHPMPYAFNCHCCHYDNNHHNKTKCRACPNRRILVGADEKGASQNEWPPPRLLR